MPEITKKPRRNPWRHLAWMMIRQPLIAIGFALFFGTIFGGTWRNYVWAYKASLVFGYCIGLAMWAISTYVEPRILRDSECEGRNPSWRIGAAYIGTAIVASYVAAAILHFTFAPGFLGSPRAFLTSGLYTLLFAALFGGIAFAREFYRLAVDRARAVEQARAELAQAELRALRAQVHPHFLFNTLNSIAALIALDPPAAEEITTRLAELFRYTLTAAGRETAPLGDELTFLRNYLEIERTRFSDRLRVVEDIEPGLEAVPIPSLLLQPLVENAVRYAVSPRSEGATIRLAARRDGDVVVLEVADDGPGMDGRAPTGTGFGLHSVRERIRVAGPPHEMRVESSPGSGTCITLRLPLEPRPASSTPSPLGDFT
jgi:signal transduction histidine kinase